MTTSQFLTSAWNWNPWVIALCAATFLPWLVRGIHGFSARGIWLVLGAGLFFVTLCSPIDALANGYLFSAHMLQHLLLLLIVPLLILLGVPEKPAPQGVAKGGWRGDNFISRRPLLCWVTGVGGMWLWHAPALCNAAVSNFWVHRLQYVSLLVMGLAFWWPIIGPGIRQRLAPLTGMIYLFTACLGCTILGIIITFSPVEVCSIYLHPVDRLGIMPLLQDQWGLTPGKDQQLGGLLMWVPACLVYFFGILGLLARWYREPSQEILIAAAAQTPLLEKPHGL
jgi:putative membrane protein